MFVLCICITAPDGAGHVAFLLGEDAVARHEREYANRVAIKGAAWRARPPRASAAASVPTREAVTSPREGEPGHGATPAPQAVTRLAGGGGRGANVPSPSTPRRDRTPPTPPHPR